MKSSPLAGPHVTAVLQGLLVAFLWSTSWVLIKSGLSEIPPLVFAGLRYFLAFIFLLIVYLVGARNNRAPNMPRRMWMRLVALGVLLYTVAQGALFVALDYLPAVTVNLLLNFTSLAVALLSAAWLSEKPSTLQWAGIILALAGAIMYFRPASVPRTQMLGVLATLVGVASNAISTIVGRDVNRGEGFSPLQVTVVSMGAGAIALLAIGLMLEGMPSISLTNWLFILWLALVNTALTFTLWNHTLRTLTAVESSVVNGTMMIWIPILAVLFIGEHITSLQLAGLMAAGAGTLIVQLRRGNAERLSAANARPD